MTLAVKKIKSRLYVYYEYLCNRKVYTVYIEVLGGDGESLPDIQELKARWRNSRKETSGA